MKVNEAIYETMQEVRTSNGLTLDSIATESRKLGTTWTAGFLSGMKRNKSAASLGNMLVLCRALTSLTGKQIILADLFPGDGDIELDDGIVINRKQIRNALSGHTYCFEGESVMDNPVIRAVSQAIIDALPDYMQQFSNKLVEEASNLYGDDFTNHVPTLSEQRAADRLSISPNAMAALCLLSYGDYLDEVSSKLAGVDASPQLRGRRTRDIIDFLDRTIDHIMETGEKPGSWEQNARRYHQIHASPDSPIIDPAHLDPTNPDHVQWMADHADELGAVAKDGDTEAEQKGYEELP
ncbi:MAG: hypothetical protein UHD09_08305 [Bifidobacterium sp.]|nr:hypothetical protein [Bifidobacterium sp.]